MMEGGVVFSADGRLFWWHDMKPKIEGSIVLKMIWII